MELIRGIYNIKPAQKRCVVTIGNFDGVHLAHHALLEKLIQVAQDHGLPAVVILFEPQPNEYFSRGKITPRLMRLREKIMALQNHGIDRVLCLRFNSKLANLPAEKFIEEVLVEQLAIQHVIIGDDFHFGYQRHGNFALLKQFAEKYQFAAEQMPTILQHDLRISSSRIRIALEVGDLLTAKQLLGRSFAMSGRVAHGDKRGRMIGFPTANIFLHRKAVPIAGVYVVQMHGLSEQPIAGVANVGTRPTVDGTRSLLEVHLFNFQQEIYGAHVEVEFLAKLRDEKRYDSFELLRQQIMKDAEEAKHYFGM